MEIPKAFPLYWCPERIFNLARKFQGSSTGDVAGVIELTRVTDKLSERNCPGSTIFQAISHISSLLLVT